MRTIRNKVFETNSSSMHSIVIMNEDKKLDIEENVLHWGKSCWKIKNIDDLTFDRWPFEILTTFIDKARYVIADTHNVESINAIIKKYIPDFEKIILPIEQGSVYEDENGKLYYSNDVEYAHDLPWGQKFIKGTNKIVTLNDNLHVDYEYTGNVDHQSSGLITDFLKTKNISLEEFLTNDKYKIVIDGDEYCELDKLIKAGIIDPIEVFPKNEYEEDDEE